MTEINLQSKSRLSADNERSVEKKPPDSSQQTETNKKINIKR